VRNANSFHAVATIMSIPPQSNQGKALEDCRDYLRTGRCKYGASCKYNHPANVQNGGGIKPLDPSEPMFPVRPNEPVCQYYLKHGTCKFGQACKFDHPPHHAMQALNGGGQVQLMNAGRMNEPVPQLVLNPIGADANGMVLQFLPQRVDEPDCIYFLKNGRCKYGATCRYHHPVHPQQTARRVESKPRRQQDPYNRAGQKVQYVTQMVPSYSNQGGQVIMPYDNNPVTYMNADGSSGPAQSYQIITGSDGVTSYCVPAGSVVVTEQGSSASSIASSSYETAQEHLSDQWSRSRRNGSGGSLSAYTNDGRQQRVFLSHSSSEGNMVQVQRQTRTSSYGSAGEMSSTGLPRNGSGGSWNQRMHGSQYIARQEPNTRSPVIANVQRRIMRRRSPRGGEGSDEGFTMMTSALLHMLDTPEEAAAESYSDDEYLQHVAEQYRTHDQIDVDLFERMSLQDPSVAHHQARHQEETQSYADPAMFEQLSVHAPYTPVNQLSPPSASHEGGGSSWSPTWLGAVQGPDDSADAFSLMHHHKSHAPAPTSSHESDVGLYLP
jgi:Zinc finger C-x8-C-x5-C-x3-H type (and similar)